MWRSTSRSTAIPDRTPISSASSDRWRQGLRPRAAGDKKAPRSGESRTRIRAKRELCALPVFLVQARSAVLVDKRRTAEIFEAAHCVILLTKGAADNCRRYKDTNVTVFRWFRNRFILNLCF